MIEEIKKRLEAGEVVELECVDEYIFINISSDNEEVHNRKSLLNSCLKVASLDLEGDVVVGGGFYYIPKGCLKHFRIKRTSNYDPIEGKGTLPILDLQGKGTPIFSKINFPNSDPDLSDKPTFDDLIDVAVQAYKDGVLKSLKLLDCGVHSLSYSVNADVNGDENTIFSQLEDYSDGINFINSLYTETFVIEGSSCILKINENIQSLVLANGRDIVDRIYFEGGSIRLRDCFGNSISLTSLNILKGATVTQKKI